MKTYNLPFTKLILALAVLAMITLVATSCSANYCPSYSGHSYNKSGGKKANTSVMSNRKR